MESKNAVAAFIKYSEELTHACKETPNVIGLVLVGSTAETFRVDEWSDHDFFVITVSGAQEALRQDLSWLPHSEGISFWFRETEHGLKVVYQSGAVLEFAIFDCDELRACGVNHHRLAFGSPEVVKALSTAAARTSNLASAKESKILSDFHHFLSLILIGVGRARRGEVLTAGQGIRSYAAGALLKVLTQHLGEDSRLDKLDPWRRFEDVHPILGLELAQALENEPEIAAQNLLTIAEKFLASSWNEFPFREIEVVKNSLGWTR